MNRKQRRADRKQTLSTASPGTQRIPRGSSSGVQNLFAEGVRHHQAGSLVEAERAYRQVLAADARHPDALHLLGVIAYQVGRNDVAVALIGQAIEIDGTVAAYASNLGNALQGLGRIEDSVAAYNTAIRLEPSHAEARSNLGNALKELGNLDAAVAACATAICLKPDFADAQSNLGNALQGLGRFDDSVAAYKRSIRVNPGLAEAYSNLGNALKALGRLDAAVASCATAICLKPDHADAHFNQGNALNDLGRLNDAVAAVNKAIRLIPSYAEAHSNLGNALQHLGRLDAAEAAYSLAICLKPDLAEAYANLGNALQDLGRFGPALAACAAAVCLMPDVAETQSNLGNGLKRLGRLCGSVAAYNTAICLKPDYADAYSNLGSALQDLAQFDRAVAVYNAALRVKPDYAEAHSNLLMCLHYCSNISGDAILSEARRFADMADALRDDGDDLGTPLVGLSRSFDPDRRVRIGYVSGDFRNHPVGYFIRGVLACHDPASVEVICYSNYAFADAMTRELQAKVHHWRSLVGLSDRDAAKLIAADEIDILVDLSGHTAHNRLPMFARRPAPVQVTWLGFWGATGLPTMDYILSDDVTIPPEEERFYSEKVLRLPSGRFCYQPPDYAPSPALPPSLRQEEVTFGSFNNLAKVGPDVVALWARVLLNVPGSKLLLKWTTLADEGVRRQLTDNFAAQGIEPDRLVLRGASPHAAMFAEYGDIDIALDPFPFSGGLTSCEALWMGVPVVTLPGKGAASRQTAGFLRTIGHPDWIAAHDNDYLRIATELAADAAHRSELSRTLRSHMAVSPLCDAPAFTRGLEEIYRQMWRDRCERR